MKLIAGNKDFYDNAKQLLPNHNIFTEMIINPPSENKGIFWNDGFKLNGTINSNNLYRSCYYINLENDPTNFTLEVKNSFNNQIIDLKLFKTWAVYQVDDSTYMFYIWFDMNQKFKLTWNRSDINDYYLQVVI